MNISHIVAQIDAEIARLQQAKAILIGKEASSKQKPGRSAAGSSSSKATSFNPAEFAAATPRRTISPEARDRIAAAQKKRWAKAKRAEKKAARNAAATPAAKKTARKGVAKKAPAVKKVPSAKKTATPAPETVAPAS